MTALEAREVTVAFDDRIVLADVSLAAHRGEVLGLLGPNGAGKSTLLKALAGLLPCDGCCLDGRPIRDVPPRERARQLAYLPQGNASHWPMVVADVVALGRLPHQDGRRQLSSEDRHAIRLAIEETGVQDLVDRPMNKLSGGERARVLLARALAVDARSLLADEPTAHLDVNHQLALLRLLRRRADSGHAVILVLHDLSAALRFCDRVAVLADGRLVAEGRPADVLTDELLERRFGIEVARAEWHGTPFFQAWAAVAP